MAQTKRKRSTKHRGNAAGQIEARGRTGRRPEASERRPAAGRNSKQAGKSRLDEPPTWRSSAIRALVASALVLVFVGLVLGFTISRLATLLPLLLLYIPLGYYTDLLLYRRRQKQKQQR